MNARNKKIAIAGGAAAFLIVCGWFLRMPAPALANLSRPKLILAATQDVAPAGQKGAAMRAKTGTTNLKNLPAASRTAGTPEERRKQAEERRRQLVEQRRLAREGQGGADVGAPPVRPVPSAGAPGRPGGIPAPRPAGIGRAMAPAEPPNEPETGNEPPGAEGSDSAIE